MSFTSHQNAFRGTNGGQSWANCQFPTIGSLAAFACPSVLVCEAEGGNRAGFDPVPVSRGNESHARASHFLESAFTIAPGEVHGADAFG